VKVVIIEDEKLSAEHLTMLLQKIDPAIEVVKYMDTVKATIREFQEGLEADLIFLDIHLADGNSFEIFTALQINIPIIFTTAYDNYAIQAFKQNSIDYLLKPVSKKDVAFSLEKFKKQNQVANKQLIENITSTYLQLNKQYKSRFLVKKGQGIDYVQVEEVHHFETRESLSFLVTANGNRFPIDYTLDQLETLLPPKNFFRINRKIIIHITSIEKVDNYFNSRLAITSKLLDSEGRIVSRERVNDFKLWLDN
jgi:DNA-binding LytR/AlgR family response regulator